MNYKKLFLTLAIALMLPFLWVSTDAQGQTVCPGVDHPDGWFRMNVQYPDDTFVGSQFTGGLYGSFESTDFGVMGDLDWMYNDASFTEFGGPGTNTTQAAEAQVVTWWTQKNSRNTHVQFTNDAEVEGDISGPGQADLLGTDPFGDPLPLGVHVQVFNEDCTEVIDFCDFYTPKDTHVYNLGDLVTNNGQEISTSTLQGNEGFMTITPVVNCGTDDRAIEFTDLYGTVRIVDTANDVDYGVNAWGRDADAQPANGIGCFESVEGGEAFILTGGPGCEINPLEPDVLSQNYATTGEGPAADVVVFSFGDVYNNDASEIGYQPASATAVYNPDIFDDQENLISCPAIETCFARFGVNDAIPVSEDFVAPTPDPTPTPEPTPTPDPTPTPEPTDTGGDGGDGGGCTVAATATAATAAANFLLPLLPLAGAYGIRRFRRRNK